MNSINRTAKWVLLLILVGAFLFINWPFVMPLFLSGIFALGLNDFILKLSEKSKFKRKYAIASVILFGLALFWIPITLAIYRIIINLNKPQAFETDQIISQIHNLKVYLVGLLQKVTEWTGYDLATPAQGMIENVLKAIGENVLNYSSQFLGQLPSILLGSFVFIISVIVLLAYSTKIKSRIIILSPLKIETTETIVKALKESCATTLFSTLVIGIIQAGIIGFGSLVFGEGDFWLVLTVTFFVSFIPVVGAAPVGFLLSALAFIGGRTGSGVGLLVIAAIAGTIDNVLKPIMVGKESNINPLVGFTCVVGAIIMLGLPGLLIGPVIMNLFVTLTPILLEE